MDSAFVKKLKANVFSDEYYIYLKFNSYKNKHKIKGNIRQLRRPIPTYYWQYTPILTILNELFPHYCFTQRERLIVYLQYIQYHPFSSGIKIYDARISELSEYEMQTMFYERIMF